MPKTIPVVSAGEARTPPPFARIGVVGLGLIGGSIALAARQLWPAALVVGVDRNDALEDAQRAHAVDVAADDLGMLAEVDLVVLAAPVLANIGVLRELADAVHGAAVVTDVGSTKAAIVDAGRRLPERLTFVGGHPLAGAARAGIQSASPEMFRQRPWILTPDGPVSGDALARVEQFVTSLGGVPRIMTPGEHDRVIGWISHLPQLTASALMRVIGDAVGADGLGLSGRGLRETTRLAGSPASIWADICRTNSANIGVALDALIGQLQRLRMDLDEGTAIDEVFAAASGWRARLPDGSR